MARTLNTLKSELGSVEIFNQVEITLNEEAVTMAELMLVERRQRVMAFSDQLGTLLGIDSVLDDWLDATTTDPAVVLN